MRKTSVCFGTFQRKAKAQGAHVWVSWVIQGLYMATQKPESHISTKQSIKRFPIFYLCVKNRQTVRQTRDGEMKT